MNDYTKQLEEQNEALQQKLSKFERTFSELHEELYIVERVIGRPSGIMERHQTIIVYSRKNLKCLIDSYKKLPLTAGDAAVTSWVNLGFVIRHPIWAIIQESDMIEVGRRNVREEYYFKQDFTWVDGWYLSDTNTWECNMISDFAGVCDMRFLEEIGAINLTELPDG